jgi:hypothetical protein
LLTTHRMNVPAAEMLMFRFGKQLWRQGNFPNLGVFPKRRGPSPKGVPVEPTLSPATSYHAVGAECQTSSMYGRQQAGVPQAYRCWSYAWCWQ